MKIVVSLALSELSVVSLDVRGVETLAQLKEKVVLSAAGGFSGVIYSVAPCLSFPARSSEELPPELFPF